MGVGERSLVGDGRWIEDGDIRKAARPNTATIREPEALRRHACHLAHRLLEREHVLHAHVFTQHARERAVIARVRHTFARS